MLESAVPASGCPCQPGLEPHAPRSTGSLTMRCPGTGRDVCRYWSSAPRAGTLRPRPRHTVTAQPQPFRPTCAPLLGLVSVLCGLLRKLRGPLTLIRAPGGTERGSKSQIHFVCRGGGSVNLALASPPSALCDRPTTQIITESLLSSAVLGLNASSRDSESEGGLALLWSFVPTGMPRMVPWRSLTSPCSDSK